MPKKLKNFNFKKIFLFGSPILITIISIVIYFAFSLNKNEKNNEKDNADDKMTSLLDNDNLKIFPELKQQDFYKFIKIKNGSPYIDDDMISEVLNYVFLKMQSPNGEVKWNFYFDDILKRNNLLIYFLWNPISSFIYKPIIHSYHFDISKIY